VENQITPTVASERMSMSAQRWCNKENKAWLNKNASRSHLKNLEATPFSQISIGRLSQTVDLATKQDNK